MIEQFKGCTREKENLRNFLNETVDTDFYLTDNNQRVFSFDKVMFSKLVKSSVAIYYLRDNGDYVGAGFIWKARGGEVNRYYVKLKTNTPEIATQILTIMLWNSPVKTLHGKLSKESKYFKVFTNKGFKWFHGRGKEALLSRTELRDKSVIVKKDDADFIESNRSKSYVGRHKN